MDEQERKQLKQISMYGSVELLTNIIEMYQDEAKSMAEDAVIHQHIVILQEALAKIFNIREGRLLEALINMAKIQKSLDIS